MRVISLPPRLPMNLQAVSASAAENADFLFFNPIRAAKPEISEMPALKTGQGS